jgi:hypothetical protein
VRGIRKSISFGRRRESGVPGVRGLGVDVDIITIVSVALSTHEIEKPKNTCCHALSDLKYVMENMLEIYLDRAICPPKRHTLED